MISYTGSSPVQKVAAEPVDTELRPLYLDAQATTPLDPRVLDAMLPYLTHQYGNPHSRTHAYGWDSEKAMEKARQVIQSISSTFAYCLKLKILKLLIKWYI